MEKILRKVKCSERLPKIDGKYYCQFNNSTKDNLYFECENYSWSSSFCIVTTPEYWYEEVDLADIMVESCISHFSQEDIDNYKKVSSKLLQDEAKAKYDKALKYHQEEYGNWLEDEDIPFCKTLKIAAGLEEI